MSILYIWIPVPHQLQPCSTASAAGPQAKLLCTVCSGTAYVYLCQSLALWLAV